MYAHAVADDRDASAPELRLALQQTLAENERLLAVAAAVDAELGSKFTDSQRRLHFPATAHALDRWDPGRHDARRPDVTAGRAVGCSACGAPARTPLGALAGTPAHYAGCPVPLAG